MVKFGGKEENSEDFLDPETPFGEKKRLSSQMAKQWYAWWEKSGFFVADAKSSKPPFVIVLPPPNVTGALHIGHALTAAVEDTIIRWRKMSGYNTLWVPGMDHTGIATQVVVEKKIMRERKLTRHDIGREKFISEDWKNKFGGTILQQLRRLGASLDWSRECFIMDEKRSRAVTEAFVRLYKENLVYRGERLVNWDCVLRIAISDIEVEHIEIKERTLLNVPGYEKPVEFGVLTSFAYPLEGELGEIVVATTRVETMLGDTAIAIHPDDPRYNHLHGKFAIHPFNGRKLPIVCDATLVDPKFGTGAVKITLAHDLNDFEFKERHNCESNIIESINIFTDDGKINSNGGSEFTGMRRIKAREVVIESLQKKGLYRGAEGNEMRLGICSRTNDVVEPLSKPQWYVKCNSMARQALTNDVVEPLSKPQWYAKCNSMARQALDAVEDKKIEIIPKQYAADWKSLVAVTYLIYVVVPQVPVKAACRYVYMHVYLHPMIRDAHGRKMSKSLGNVIDPLEVINGISLEGLHKRLEEGNLDPKELIVAKEGQVKDFPNGIPKCGTDALRFALISCTAQGWRNKRVEYDMDLVDSAVKSLRSLANERRESSQSMDKMMFSDLLCLPLYWEKGVDFGGAWVISENDVTTAGCAVSVVNENLSVYLELQGTLSPKLEFEKHGKIISASIVLYSILKYLNIFILIHGTVLVVVVVLTGDDDGGGGWVVMVGRCGVDGGICVLVVVLLQVL
ncbi:hypothetical protein SO802_028062 [Lithocarpus litseifolius]|uniref:valine--tRNA ligase n=1 Tax=Lithocarpus litseifolius TaxID=425828 RepID=A0AAW2BQQ4_9ROSI